MSEYFKDWKRKAGAVMLALACACMGMWIRSCVVEDVLTTNPFGRWRAIVSADSQIELCGWRDPDGIHVLNWTGEAFDPIRRRQGIWFSPSVQLMVHHSKAATLSYLRVPYWLLTIPATVLSVWLLLRKPHPPTDSSP